jgi:hypothetical protein
MLDDPESPFCHDRTAPESFIDPSDDDPPEILLVRAKMATTSAERKALLLEAERKVDPANARIRAEMECMLFTMVAPASAREPIWEFLFERLAGGDVPRSLVDVIAHCICEVTANDAKEEARLLWSLVLASGAFGLEQDRARAEEIWQSVDIKTAETFPPIGIDVLCEAQAAFLRKKIEIAQKEEDKARAMCLLADVLQKDRWLATVLLKQVFLCPVKRFNAVKCLPRYLPLLLKLLMNTMAGDLCRRVLERIEQEWPLGTNPDLRSQIEPYRSCGH